MFEINSFEAAPTKFLKVYNIYFPLAKLPRPVGFHRRSYPWITSLLVSSLPSSVDFKSRPETQGPSSSDLSSSSHIGRHESWPLTLRSIS